MPSPAGWAEVPCAECGEFVRGIDFGERCRECSRRRERRVSATARRSALVAVALYAMWLMSGVAASPQGRGFAIGGVVVVYLLVHLIAGRLARELLP